MSCDDKKKFTFNFDTKIVEKLNDLKFESKSGVFDKKIVLKNIRLEDPIPIKNINSNNKISFHFGTGDTFEYILEDADDRNTYKKYRILDDIEDDCGIYDSSIDVQSLALDKDPKKLFDEREKNLYYCEAKISFLKKVEKNYSLDYTKQGFLYINKSDSYNRAVMFSFSNKLFVNSRLSAINRPVLGNNHIKLLLTDKSDLRVGIIRTKEECLKPLHESILEATCD